MVPGAPMTTFPDDFDERVANLESEVLAALIRAYDKAANHIDIDALAAAIAAQDDFAIADALNMDEGLLSVLEYELDAGLFYVLLGGIILAMRAFSSRYRSRIDIQSHVVTLREELRRNVITVFARRGREAVAETIRIMTDAGFSPREIAIAARDSVALAPDQAKSAAHLQRALKQGLDHRDAQHTSGGVTLPAAAQKAIRRSNEHHLNAAQRSVLLKTLSGELNASMVASLIDRHAKALKDYRFRVMSYQEATRAIHAGEYLAFRQGKANRSLPKGAKRFWQTMGDERVRHDHAVIPGMNLNGVDVGQTFKTPLGPVLYPPLEVNCRCRVVVRWPIKGQTDA